MKITIFLGTGGVGKTSVSAATALSLAKTGGRALVLTTDPSLRLRTALGLRTGEPEQRVPGVSGDLWAALLDVNATLDDAVRMNARRGTEDQILNHPIYKTIASSLSGMHELMALERISQLIGRGFQTIVVDTAPSRHVLDVLDKPLMFADLSASRKVKLVSRTYRFVESLGLASVGRGALEIYSRAEEILGGSLVKQILDFYSLFYPVAEAYADRARRTGELLRDPSVTDFRIVTTPQKAARDADFFVAELAKRQFNVSMICVNRCWLRPLGEPQRDGLQGEVAAWYESVSRGHRNAIGKLKEKHGASASRICVLEELAHDVDGTAALGALSEQLARA
ncbi:MAG TPA: ArsA-related P-loop ATPase [Bryobacteraceae bacterium]|nr:ArsA-related P-loop ATPase [Bryobacteraceae bacterium]